MNIIKQEKFSENIVAFRYLLKFDRQTITAYNLLSYMLKCKTELYEDKNQISMEFNKNYGLKLSIGLSSYGDILSMQFRFQYIRTDWVNDPSYVKNIVQLMDQFLFHNILEQDNLDEAKFLLKNRLNMQKDDPMYESIMNAFKLVDGDYSISIPVQGYLDAIDSITLEDVSNLYEELRKQSPYVYACGIIDEEICDFIESIANKNEVEGDYSIVRKQHYKEQIVEKSIEQTCITKVYATDVEPVSKDFDALLLMNSVLGQSPINLLFQEVREKHSYCYSIGSSLIRFDGVIYVYVGCKKDNIDEILKLIDVQIQRIVDMDYSDELLDIAKKDWKDAMVAGLDNQLSHVERRFMSNLLKRTASLEERMKAIDAVSKEDISKMAKQLQAISLSIVKEDE